MNFSGSFIHQAATSCHASMLRQELLVTLPYCDLEGCPDPDPIPLGYRRVGEIFTCTDGFVETLDLFRSKEVKKI